jgi:hypothetical protein
MQGERAVALTIDTNGPGGIPGALRSAAATGPDFPMPAALALRIARRLEDQAAQVEAAKAITLERFSDEIKAQATARAERLVRLFNWSTSGAGFLLGLCAGFVLWGLQ